MKEQKKAKEQKPAAAAKAVDNRKRGKKPIKRFQINHRIEIYGRRAHANDQK